MLYYFKHYFISYLKRFLKVRLAVANSVDDIKNRFFR